MNHTYRLVWNRVLSMFVAVSESARTMGKSGGSKALAGAALAAAVLSGPAALAHTTSVGYEVLPGNTVELWYGTYHNTAFTEGSLHFTSTNGYNATVSFTDLVTIKPTGLIDGTTNFFSNGSTLGGTPNYTINTWQGVTFTNLTAGTYTFTYLPIAQPTSDWQPINSAINTGSFVITAQALATAAGGDTIDTSSPNVLISALSPTGPLKFKGGTLTMEAATPTVSQAMTIDASGGTIDQAGNVTTFSGVISDQDGGVPGALTVSNSGSGGAVVLTAAETYTGATTVNAGATLALTGAGTIGTSSNVAADGMVDLTGAASLNAFQSLSGAGTVALGANNLALTQAGGTFGGTVSGSGGVTVLGGSEAFSGVNTYAGATHIASGATLALTGAGTIGTSSDVAVDGTVDLTGAGSRNAFQSLSGAGTVALGANNLALTQAGGTFGGTVSGTGGVTVLGGSETFSGVNTYAGATHIANGATLALTGAGTIGTSSDVAVDGTVDLTGAGSRNAFQSLSGAGAGTVALGANNLALTQAGGTFGGTISGSGGVTVLGGSETFSGVNTYAGATHIASGATLALTGAGSVAASSGVLSNGTFDIGGTTAGASVASLSGSGAVALGANALTLSAAADTFAGTIAGRGALAVTGGKETLSGVNTYTGATHIASGATLALTNSLAIAASAGVVNNGMLDISATSGGASLASLDGAGAVTLGSNQLVLSNASGTFSGNISGTGGLFVSSGTETLTGVNSYTGATQINPGATLAIAGNGAISGSSGVLNNGTLTIASTLPAVMTSLAGSGTLNLAGQSVTFTQGADNFTGNITGTGTMRVTGGVQQLSGVNTIVGPVTASSGGTLKVASTVSLGAESNNIVLNNGTLNTTGTTTMARAISITSTGTFLTDGGTTLTSNGATSGTGTMVKNGAGTLVLGGDNSALRGGATINAGTVKLASSTAIGSGTVQLNGGVLETAVDLALAQNVAVAAGTRLVTDAGTTTVLSGTVSSIAGGAGCFTKSGGGTLNVTGAATFGMGVCVDQGTLRANGITGSAFVAVASGAMLRGAGTISAPISVAGTLAPGNSPGTLTSTSTVTMLAGSRYQEDINGTGTGTGPGNYSRLLISGAGQFIAGGAVLTPNLVNITGVDTYTPYVPKVGDNFRIVTAAGGVVGRFDTLVQPAGLAANTRLAAFYNGDGTNSIDLRVLPTSYASFSNTNGGNFNGQQAGVALDRIMAADQAGTASVAQARLAYSLSNLAGTSVAAATQNLAGQVHGAMAAIAPLAGQAAQGMVIKQLDQAAPEDVAARHALWVDLAGNRAQWDADSHASRLVADRGQLTVGVDALRNDTSRLGVGFSHARANLSADAGSGTLRENMAFVYGAYQGQAFGVDAMAGAGRTNAQTERANPLGAGALTSGIDGHNVLASIGVSAPWQLDGATVKPFLRVLWQRTVRDAGSEGTAVPAALSLGEYAASGTRTTAGLSGNVKGGNLGQTPYTMQYSFGVGHDSGSLARAAVDSSIAGIGSTIVAPHASRSFFQAAVSGNVMHSATTSSFYGVATEMHGNRVDVSLSGGLRYAF